MRVVAADECVVLILQCLCRLADNHPVLVQLRGLQDVAQPFSHGVDAQNCLAYRLEDGDAAQKLFAVLHVFQCGNGLGDSIHHLTQVYLRLDEHRATGDNNLFRGLVLDGELRNLELRNLLKSSLAFEGEGEGDHERDLVVPPQFEAVKRAFLGES